MTYSKEIKKAISRYKELEIFEANSLYTKSFKHIPKYAFFKTLSRLTKNNELIRVSKGVYSVPKQTRFGLNRANEKQIINYYLGENINKGISVGYQLYQRNKLTTQISRNYIIYSNNINQEIKKIDNIMILKTNLNYSINTKKVVELLEVLQNYNQIEELNYKNLYTFISNHINEYSEKTLSKVLSEIKYKKSTLASLENALNYFNIENNVNKYLNITSKYNSINMEIISELAS